MDRTLLYLGLTVFLAHFLALQFRRTHLPDVLVLMLLGIAIGPLAGWISTDDFGKVGPTVATIALVVILFEGGTSLDLGTLRRSLGTTGVLTLSSFVLSTLLIAGIGVLAFDLERLPALMLGATLGGTASAVVIPMVGALRVGVKPATVLVLESALTDVLCIVVVFALLSVYAEGALSPGELAGSVAAAMVFATVIGVVGGVGWLLVLGWVRGFPNTISATLAWVFIVYGLTEYLGFSGAIAALAMGVTLGNAQNLGLDRVIGRGRRVEPLSAEDVAFNREAVFLLKTYFFVYLGISIQFSEARLGAVAAAMVLAVYLTRVLLVRAVCRGPEYGLRDTAITAIMAPKGLAAAVLAALPLQAGVTGGETIRDLAYMVVLVSITLTALLVMLLPWRPAQRVFAAALGKPGPAAGEAAAGGGADSVPPVASAPAPLPATTATGQPPAAPSDAPR
jgi:potassium/hydrogen antiporter